VLSLAWYPSPLLVHESLIAVLVVVISYAWQSRRTWSMLFVNESSFLWYFFARFRTLNKRTSKTWKMQLRTRKLNEQVQTVRRSVLESWALGNAVFRIAILFHRISTKSDASTGIRTSTLELRHSRLQFLHSIADLRR
jgi:hypothetical protein